MIIEHNDYNNIDITVSLHSYYIAIYHCLHENSAGNFSIFYP